MNASNATAAPSVAPTHLPAAADASVDVPAAGAIVLGGLFAPLLAYATYAFAVRTWRKASLALEERQRGRHARVVADESYGPDEETTTAL